MWQQNSVQEPANYHLPSLSASLSSLKAIRRLSGHSPDADREAESRLAGSWTDIEVLSPRPRHQTQRHPRDWEADTMPAVAETTQSWVSQHAHDPAMETSRASAVEPTSSRHLQGPAPRLTKSKPPGSTSTRAQGRGYVRYRRTSGNALPPVSIRPPSPMNRQNTAPAPGRRERSGSFSNTQRSSSRPAQRPPSRSGQARKRSDEESPLDDFRHLETAEDLRAYQADLALQMAETKAKMQLLEAVALRKAAAAASSAPKTTRRPSNIRETQWVYEGEGSDADTNSGRADYSSRSVNSTPPQAIPPRNVQRSSAPPVAPSHFSLPQTVKSPLSRQDQEVPAKISPGITFPTRAPSFMKSPEPIQRKTSFSPNLQSYSSVPLTNTSRYRNDSGSRPLSSASNMRVPSASILKSPGTSSFKNITSSVIKSPTTTTRPAPAPRQVTVPELPVMKPPMLQNRAFSAVSHYSNLPAQSPTSQRLQPLLPRPLELSAEEISRRQVVFPRPTRHRREPTFEDILEKAKLIKLPESPPPEYDFTNFLLTESTIGQSLIDDSFPMSIQTTNLPLSNSIIPEEVDELQVTAAISQSTPTEASVGTLQPYHDFGLDSLIDLGENKVPRERMAMRKLMAFGLKPVVSTIPDRSQPIKSLSEVFKPAPPVLACRYNHFRKLINSSADEIHDTPDYIFRIACHVPLPTYDSDELLSDDERNEKEVKRLEERAKRAAQIPLPPDHMDDFFTYQVVQIQKKGFDESLEESTSVTIPVGTLVLDPQPKVTETKLEKSPDPIVVPAPVGKKGKVVKGKTALPPIPDVMKATEVMESSQSEVEETKVEKSPDPIVVPSAVFKGKIASPPIPDVIEASEVIMSAKDDETREWGGSKTKVNPTPATKKQKGRKGKPEAQESITKSSVVLPEKVVDAVVTQPAEVIPVLSGKKKRQNGKSKAQELKPDLPQPPVLPSDQELVEQPAPSSTLLTEREEQALPVEPVPSDEKEVEKEQSKSQESNVETLTPPVISSEIAVDTASVPSIAQAESEPVHVDAPVDTKQADAEKSESLESTPVLVEPSLLSTSALVDPSLAPSDETIDAASASTPPIKPSDLESEPQTVVEEAEKVVKSKGNRQDLTVDTLSPALLTKNHNQRSPSMSGSISSLRSSTSTLRSPKFKSDSKGDKEVIKGKKKTSDQASQIQGGSKNGKRDSDPKLPDAAPSPKVVDHDIQTPFGSCEMKKENGTMNAVSGDQDVVGVEETPNRDEVDISTESKSLSPVPVNVTPTLVETKLPSEVQDVEQLRAEDNQTPTQHDTILKLTKVASPEEVNDGAPSDVSEVETKLDEAKPEDAAETMLDAPSRDVPASRHSDTATIVSDSGDPVKDAEFVDAVESHEEIRIHDKPNELQSAGDIEKINVEPETVTAASAVENAPVIATTEVAVEVGDATPVPGSHIVDSCSTQPTTVESAVTSEAERTSLPAPTDDLTTTPVAGQKVDVTPLTEASITPAEENTEAIAGEPCGTDDSKVVTAEPVVEVAAVVVEEANSHPVDTATVPPSELSDEIVAAAESLRGSDADSQPTGPSADSATEPLTVVESEADATDEKPAPAVESGDIVGPIENAGAFPPNQIAEGTPTVTKGDDDEETRSSTPPLSDVTAPVQSSFAEVVKPDEAEQPTCPVLAAADYSTNIEVLSSVIDKSQTSASHQDAELEDILDEVSDKAVGNAADAVDLSSQASTTIDGSAVPVDHFEGLRGKALKAAMKKAQKEDILRAQLEKAEKSIEKLDTADKKSKNSKQKKNGKKQTNGNNFDEENDKSSPNSPNSESKKEATNKLGAHVANSTEKLTTNTKSASRKQKKALAKNGKVAGNSSHLVAGDDQEEAENEEQVGDSVETIDSAKKDAGEEDGCATPAEGIHDEVADEALGSTLQDSVSEDNEEGDDGKEDDSQGGGKIKHAPENQNSKKGPSNNQKKKNKAHG